MQTEKPEASFTSRFLQGARDLIWQDDPRVKRNVPAADIPAPPARREKESALGQELLEAVMSRPTAYSAFAEAVSALSDVHMDEATRYRSAFAILRKTQQRSVEQIAQAVDVHLGALEAEVMRFNGQSKSVEEAEITARIKEADEMKAAIEQTQHEISALRAETEARIRHLEEEIESKRAQAGELLREGEEKKQMVAQTERDFSSAAEAIRSKLIGEREKIRKLLS